MTDPSRRRDRGGSGSGFKLSWLKWIIGIGAIVLICIRAGCS